MEKRVTIGDVLFLVSTQKVQNDVVEDLIKKIQSHKEEKILRLLLNSAISGDTQALLGKTIPPIELEDEGIRFEAKGENVFALFGPSSNKAV